ncbi:MAG: MBL fold metallo-hydrolase, partial [bacterium]|nr:MBL fold metallo-hydrolase [bacterium]
MRAKLTFMGATGTVTGSRFLLETDGNKILIDCGLFQGLKANRLRNWDPFPVNPSEIDCILLTHAHIDHCGYIPRLCKQGFAGKIHCTFATHELCKILLHDSGYLQEEDAHWANKKGFSKHKPALPLYTIADANASLKQFSPIHYGEDLFITDSIRVKFKDAGHILGSSFIDIKLSDNDDVRRFLFSGDIGSPNRPIVHDPAQVYEVDYLIMESTYGNRRHTDSHTSRDEELARVINDSIKRGGILIIPSFAVGRTQELLYYIRELEEKETIPVLPVYVDSPMAIEATNVFEEMKNDYDLESKLRELEGTMILRPQQLHLCKKLEDSKKLRDLTGPAIIISASGMLEGGRVLHHLQQRLPDPTNTVLFVGYQAEGTRGRAILNGKQEIKIHG